MDALFSPARLKVFNHQYLAFRRSMREGLTTLILGSSHGHYGFLPGKGEFNLAHTSQDLYYSCQLYSKFQDLANLRTIYLFFSVFSAGYVLERSSDREYALFYKYFYGIPFRCHIGHGYPLARKNIADALPGCDSRILKTYRGAASHLKFYCAHMDAKRRAEEHWRLGQRKYSLLNYVRKMTEIATRRGHWLYVVVPPARHDYVMHLPSSERILQPLSELAAGNPVARLLNFLNDSDFIDSDFGDMDHLNLQGARRLTEKIRAAVKQSRLNGKNRRFVLNNMVQCGPSNGRKRRD